MHEGHQAPLRCCVFGAGGVGGHMAVRLARSGLPVSVVARGAHLDAIQQNGLRLLLEDGTSLQARVRGNADPAELGVQDVLVISVKLSALPQVLAAAQPLIDQRTRVVFAMNGMPWWFPHRLPVAPSPRLKGLLDPGSALADRLSMDQWVACVVTSGNRLIAPGIIQSESQGRDTLVLGFEDGRSSDPIVETFIDHARAGGYQARFTSEIRMAIWRKLLTNAAVSAVSTVADSSTRVVCDHPATRELIARIMNEILAIGRALGISLDVRPEELVDPARMPAHITSFLQDRRAGKPLEVSNGILAVQELATITKVAAPCLDTIARFMQLFSDGAGRSDAHDDRHVHKVEVQPAGI